MQLKHTLVSLAVVFAATAVAQPTLNVTNNRPVDGQQFPIQTLDGWVWEGPSGAGANFAFYDLYSTGNRTYTVLPASATPASASVPAANMISTDGGSDTLFWNYASDGLYQVGARTSLELLSSYTDPILEIKYPCTFGTTWSDVTIASYTSPAGATTRTGTIMGIADAYGALGVPGRSESNVLRVKVRRDLNDQVSVPPLVVTSRRITNTYYYFTEEIPWPVLRFVVDSVSFNGGGFSVVKSAQWMGTHGGVGIGEVAPDDVVFTPYPNPTNGVVDLRLGQAEVRAIEVFDATGHLVRTRSLRAGQAASAALDLTGLSAGVYQVRVTQADGRRGSQRVVLQ
jgi:hypothetical protein